MRPAHRPHLALPTNARRHWLRGALGLAGCGLLPKARACEFYTSTLRVTHPYCRATEPGEHEAMVCMRFDEVSRSDRLVAVHTPVASGAEMAGALARPRVDFAIPEGQETWLDEHGTWLRLTGVKAALGLGRAYPLQLDFEHGGPVLAQLTVDFPRMRFK